MLFGTSYPKLKTVGGVDILLERAVVLRDEPIWKTRVHESELDGTREIYARNDGWLFECMLHVFKYGDSGAKFSEIYAKLFDSDLHLYRHSDGPAMKDLAGVDLLFAVVELEPVYLTDHNKEDGLIIKLESLAAAAMPIPKTWLRITEKGRDRVTEKGRRRRRE